VFSESRQSQRRTGQAAQRALRRTPVSTDPPQSLCPVRGHHHSGGCGAQRAYGRGMLEDAGGREQGGGHPGWTREGVQGVEDGPRMGTGASAGGCGLWGRSRDLYVSSGDQRLARASLACALGVRRRVCSRWHASPRRRRVSRSPTASDRGPRRCAKSAATSAPPIC